MKCNVKDSGFCFSRHSFSVSLARAISALTKRSRYRVSGEYILVSRLELLCHERGISLSRFFYALERGEDVEHSSRANQHLIKTDARIYYKVIDSIAKSKSISYWDICLANNWDYSNFRREKQLAINGERKTFSLMKLFGILAVLDVSFSAFFLICEHSVTSYMENEYR